jgi:hypothetical protein
MKQHYIGCFCLLAQGEGNRHISVFVLISLLAIFLSVLGTFTKLRAAEFQNLDFESVVPPLVPDPNDLFGRVPIESALPYWHGYVAGVEQTSVFYLNSTAGSAFLAIWAKDVGFPTLEGNYSAAMIPSPSSAVTISQTGHIPGDSRTLHFDLRSVSPQPMSVNDIFGVFINGQQLPAVDLLDGPGYSIYGADVSNFSGQDVNLTFTAFNLNFPHHFVLDSISFSPTPVPEPSTLALFALAGVLGWRCWRRKAA